MQGLGISLNDPPQDGISAVRFSDRSDNLLVSSWDRKVRLYDATANELKKVFVQSGPVLDCCFQDEMYGFSGGIQKIVRRHNFETGEEEVMGSHDSTVKCVEYSHATGQLISGGWDCHVYGWDFRSSSHADSATKDKSGTVNSVTRVKVPERVYSMSLNGFTLVVATSARQILTFDLRNLSQILHQRESSLKFQTRCVRVFPDNSGYAISSVEGRVAMEFFDFSETTQSKKYAFKCHRRMEGGRDFIFPVNDIQFHPVFGTFASGGCDGIVNVWDGNNKKRLFQYPKYPTSISSLSFNNDGRLLAIASSYTYEFGEIMHEPDAIFIRAVNEIEVKPKPKIQTEP